MSLSLFYRSARTARGLHKRPGNVLLLSAFLMIVMMAALAFSIDLGYMMVVKTELQRATDAAALAGVSQLANGADAAETEARAFAELNPVGGRAVTGADAQVEFGHWDDVGRAFQISDELPSALRVTLRRDRQNLFFARALGREDFSTETQAIASYRPRDIMLVLDYSASMNDDSELGAIGKLGRAAVEANLLQIYQELGSPRFGNMQWTPVYISSTNTTTIKNTLGISNVPYPYPRGSWNEYISYVINDATINGAGYRKKYGYLTWVNYLLETRPMKSETPDLWKTSEQPITALKNGVSVLLSFLQTVASEDRLGLAVYTSSSSDAVLESGLTTDMASIETISRQRQAGHYDHYTNIGAGMRVGRQELVDNARVGALKLMVLMTDGIANRPTNEATARNYVITQANAAAAEDIPIVTISLGLGADIDLMQQVADITGGVHFNIPGNQTVAEVEEDLEDVFREVAATRPLKLVQ
jgi:Flp pilus assembly protein TadG